MRSNRTPTRKRKERKRRKRNAIADHPDQHRMLTPKSPNDALAVHFRYRIEKFCALCVLCAFALKFGFGLDGTKRHQPDAANAPDTGRSTARSASPARSSATAALLSRGSRPGRSADPD